VARAPRNGMISAGRIAREANASYSLRPFICIQRKTTAKGDRAADAMADHRIIFRAECCEVTLIREHGVEDVPALKAKQRVRDVFIVRLDELVKLRRGESTRTRPYIEAQAVGREGFGCGDLTAGKPLRVSVRARERHRADDASAIYHNGPEVIIEA